MRPEDRPTPSESHEQHLSCDNAVTFAQYQQRLLRDHQARREELRSRYSPCLTRLLATVGKFAAAMDSVNAIMSGDATGGTDGLSSCHSIPGVPGDGLSMRSMCLAGAANRAHVILLQATRQAEEMLAEAIDENRAGWKEG